MTKATHAARVKRLRNVEAGAPARPAPEVFGRILAHYRERAGKKQEELAAALNVSRSHISRFESGNRVPDRRHVEDADGFLAADGALVKLWEETDWYAEVEHPDWFERRARMDAEAVAIYDYHALVVPGLLQSEDYVRAVHVLHGDQGELEKRVAARVSRQLRFRNPDGPTLVAVLDESCLRTAVGNDEIMRDQCERLLELGAQPNISVHIAPARQYGIARPFLPMSLLAMPDGHRWVYSETLKGAYFSDDPQVVARHSRTYDGLRADAMSARDSAALIREAMEGYDRDDHARGKDHLLGEEQLQQRQRRRLRGNRVRVPRPRRPRA
ncbi:helix-turn-helix transcriptional regulator [Streptomyces sp. NPDC004959]|uniref:helix-turn-helix domain-containing protein n=1 Tax=unclassified Streptomyces TaxID=2593676 RepID=UPI00099886BA|nr:helix-turn-helix transcriptional regulator [Streptomyces sp. NRRL F-5630]